MNGLHIRNSRPSDRDRIEAVTLSAYHEYAASMPAYWEGYRANILATLSTAAAAEQIVAEQNNRIVGAVLLYPAGGAIVNPGNPQITLSRQEVRLLAVDPAARGQGIGAALMNECIRRVRDSGTRVLTLHTTDLMQAAMRLYERLGFQRDRELDFEPVPGATVKGYRLNLDTTAT
jgi:ribosomal protein S18 acetylase RimI-like enzyme